MFVTFYQAEVTWNSASKGFDRFLSGMVQIVPTIRSWGRGALWWLSGGSQLPREGLVLLM